MVPLTAWALTLASTLSIYATTVTGRWAQQQQQPANFPVIRNKANALVTLALEVFDSNGDGRVALTEVSSLTDRYLFPMLDRGLSPNEGPGPVRGPRPGPRSPDSRTKSYTLTIAQVADVDNNGYLETDEIRRAANILLDQAGDRQVGEAIELAVEVQGRIGDGPELSTEEKTRMIFDIIDGNSDGIITEIERRALREKRQFVHFSHSLSAYVPTGDENGDGDLTRAEAQVWLNQIATGPSWRLRVFTVYKKIKEMAGVEMSELWARE